MDCEKCGKMNVDGGMFCSNCSSILRSRRTAEPAKKPIEAPISSDTAEDATRRIPVTTAAKLENEAPKMPEWEEKYTAPKSTYQTKRAPSVPERKRQIPSYYDDYEEEAENTVKFCSAWCNILSVVSWVVFIVLMAVGIVGGATLVLLGVKQGESMMYFGGTAVIILFTVFAFAYHARNMVQIKILRKFNEKNR